MKALAKEVGITDGILTMSCEEWFTLYRSPIPTRVGGRKHVEVRQEVRSREGWEESSTDREPLRPRITRQLRIVEVNGMVGWGMVIFV